MISTKEERRQAVIRQFRDLAGERIARLGAAWVQIEQAPGDGERVAELMREIHTLKGEAKVVGFADVTVLAHRTEDLLLRAKARGFAVPPQVGNVVLACLDTLRRLVARTAADAPVELESVLRAADACLAPAGSPGPAAAEPPRPSPPASAEVAPRPGEASIRVRSARITAISDVAADLLAGRSEHSFVIRALQRELSKLRQRSSARAGPSAREGADGDEPRAGTPGPDGNGSAEAAHRLFVQLVELDQRQETNLRVLDRAVRDLRLVPMATVMDPFRRAVRDLAVEQGKEAALSVDGEEIEVDKRVLEHLEEPLLHLLRNAVDHGIERPEAREKAGKPRQGRISVSVAPRGAEMCVAIADDGAGMDPTLLRRAAVERGLVPAEAAAALSDPEALNLTFLPGLTTRREATEVSGRGVGMDVVKRRVEELGGRLALKSESGRGTRLEMVVPASASMTRCLVVPVGTERYAIPSPAIVAVRRIDPADVMSIHGGERLRIDGEALPVARLTQLVAGRAESPPSVGLVLRSAIDRAAVLVEGVGREAELLVRPLGPPLRGLGIVSGAAVLDDGQLAVVLNAAELLALARRRQGEVGRDLAPVGAGRGRTKVLFAEDSPIFRALVSDILRGLGHTVTAVEDGARALEVLGEFGPDLILTDIEMPRLDGIELIRRVRSNARFARVPIVVLSTAGAAADQRRALDAGADAYLVKSELKDRTVADAVERFLG